MDLDKTLVCGTLTVGLGTVTWNGVPLRQAIASLQENDWIVGKPNAEAANEVLPINNSTQGEDLRKQFDTRLAELEARMHRHDDWAGGTHAQIGSIIRDLDEIMNLPGVKEALAARKPKSAS